MDLDAYLHRYRQRDRALRTQRQERAMQVRKRLPEVVRLLKDEFAATCVILFGSLCRGQLTEHSDLDLAVAGIRPEDYFRVLARVSETAGISTDLILLEEASPSLRKRIDTEGETLYG